MIIGIDASQELLVPPVAAQATVLLCHFDGTNGATSSTDSSGSAHALTFTGNAALETATPKFGSAALRTGTTGTVTAGLSADWALTRQFTLEMELSVLTALNQDGQMVGFDNGSLTSWSLQYNNSGELQFFWSNDGTLINNLTTPASIIPSHDTYYAIAVDRDEAGELRIYVNGTMVAKGPSYETYLPTMAAGILTIGGFQDFDGFLIDELRITNHGARYASDSGYTPSGIAFTS